MDEGIHREVVLDDEYDARHAIYALHDGQSDTAGQSHVENGSARPHFSEFSGAANPVFGDKHNLKAYT